ncbi:MAG: hypothetical protein FWE95_11410, partial [Planctomycetaceae bacterium]|nr:hypothetical protein [Planctomycetaceae bacterium]
TCTEDGYWTYTCVDCGDVVYAFDESTAFGHHWGLPLWDGETWFVFCEECSEICDIGDDWDW